MLGTQKQTRMHLLMRGKSINYRDISSKGAIAQLKRMNDAVLTLHDVAMERMKLPDKLHEKGIGTILRRMQDV